MTTNIGTIDRVLRVVLGIALIALALGAFPGYTSVWGWIGIIPLATGLFGTCFHTSLAVIALRSLSQPVAWLR